MNQEFNYIQPVWLGDCVPQLDTICNYYLLTDNDWFLLTFRKQAADLHRQLNLRSVFRNVSVERDSGFMWFLLTGARVFSRACCKEQNFPFFIHLFSAKLRPWFCSHRYWGDRGGMKKQQMGAKLWWRHKLLPGNAQCLVPRVAVICLKRNTLSRRAENLFCLNTDLMIGLLFLRLAIAWWWDYRLCAQ